MATIYQLEFFEKSETSELRAEIVEVRESLNKVRKGTYAKIGAHEKRISELENDISLIKRAICKGL